MKIPPCPDSSSYNFGHLPSEFTITPEEDVNYGGNSKKEGNNKKEGNSERDTTMNIEVEKPIKKRFDGKDAVQNLCSKLLKIFGECFCKNLDKTIKKS